MWGSERQTGNAAAADGVCVSLSAEEVLKGTGYAEVQHQPVCAVC